MMKNSRDVPEQVVRELPDREDVDEVEEQLERADEALRVGRPRNRDPHGRIVCLRHQRHGDRAALV